MFDLTDRTVLVTGATGGIGAAIARMMHAKGAVVAISGRRGDLLDGLAGQLAGRVHVLPCDVANKEDVESLVPAAEKAETQAATAFVLDEIMKLINASLYLFN